MYQLKLLTPSLLSKLATDIFEFRTTFGLPVNVDNMDEFNDLLHTSLIVEELHELSEADTEVDRIDAIVDAVYVLMGRFVEYGGSTNNYHGWTPELYFVDVLLQVAERHGFDFETCWNEVHRSNMSKVCHSVSEADTTYRHYAAKGIRTQYEKIGKYLVVKCQNDAAGKIKPGKVLKSVNYSPANLVDIMYGAKA